MSLNGYLILSFKMRRLSWFKIRLAFTVFKVQTDFWKLVIEYGIRNKDQTSFLLTVKGARFQRSFSYCSLGLSPCARVKTRLKLEKNKKFQFAFVEKNNYLSIYKKHS